MSCRHELYHDARSLVLVVDVVFVHCPIFPGMAYDPSHCDMTGRCTAACCNSWHVSKLGLRESQLCPSQNRTRRPKWPALPYGLLRYSWSTPAELGERARQYMGVSFCGYPFQAGLKANHKGVPRILRQTRIQSINELDWTLSGFGRKLHAERHWIRLAIAPALHSLPCCFCMRALVESGHSTCGGD